MLCLDKVQFSLHFIYKDIMYNASEVCEIYQNVVENNQITHGMPKTCA